MTDTSYDEMPYHGIALPTTHPDHLAALATLFGMRPASVERCRVLELGCAEGGNLIPMAYTLPNSNFVGIDLAPRQIDHGRAVAASLGLTNIEFYAADLRSIDDQLGQFDYIIAYGVYSWVPPEVQQALLAICHRHLAPQGIALISYNTYPGWHLRGSIREMMRYHTDRLATAQERTAKSRALLNFLATATARLGRTQPDLGLYSQWLGLEQEILADKPDFYLFHEHLERDNNPLYFHEFVERAAAHQLQYLGDANLSSMLPASLPQEIATGLMEMSRSAIDFEQYRDFIVNRTFRETLLCHTQINLRRDLQPASMRDFAFAAPVRLVTPDEASYNPTIPKLRSPSGSVIALRTPLSAAALTMLVDVFPRALPFDELLLRSRAKIDASHATDAAAHAQRLSDALLSCLIASMVTISTRTPPFASLPGERPIASKFAQLQVRRSTSVTNLLHNTIELDPIAAQLIQFMDGSRDHAALRDELMRLIDAGGMQASVEATPDQMLQDYLNRFVRMALLVG